MKRFSLMIASGALGIALLAGATHKLTADTGTNNQPNDSVMCYYAMWSCSYDYMNPWWGDCEPDHGAGWITTASAKVICKTWHNNL